MPDRPAILEPNLPADLAVCHAMIRELLATNREQQRRIDQLTHQVDQLTKRLYGLWADRLHPDQPSLFGDPPPTDTPPPPPETPANSSTESTPASQRRGHGRRTLPANLKRVTEIVDIPEAEKLVADGAEVLTPLCQLHKDRVLAERVVHTDDTPIPVQDPDREHCRTARLWTYVSKSGTVYDATETRSRDGPIDFLRGFQGYLQCDAYAGYDELVRLSKGTVVAVGCWAHVRRKFVEAQKASPREAHEAVARIRQLYDVERTAKEQNLSDIALSQYRLEQAKPLLESFAAWLETQRVKAIPRTPLAEAIGYAINQWSTLTVYVGDGRLAIDNNTAERAIKPFAIGRKNWLFFGSDRGGRTLATLASFTATCQQFGIEPWRWLRDTLTALPLTPADQLATLLPSPTH